MNPGHRSLGWRRGGAARRAQRPGHRPLLCFLHAASAPRLFLNSLSPLSHTLLTSCFCGRLVLCGGKAIDGSWRSMDRSKAQSWALCLVA